jgi:antitoxin FitA
MIQIRNVPESVHRQLKARAALAGTSLSDYLLAELRRSLERPTRTEIVERLAHRAPVDPHPRPAAAVRVERDAGRVLPGSARHRGRR